MYDVFRNEQEMFCSSIQRQNIHFMIQLFAHEEIQSESEIITVDVILQPGLSSKIPIFLESCSRN